MKEKSPVRLNCWNYSWPLREDICPCDVHFVEYLSEYKIKEKVIFHFGTGSHHILGRSNREAGNYILGITASPEEYQSYMDFITNNPAASLRYKAFFGDVYTLAAPMLPRLDLVTLFHLCEFYDGPAEYGGLDDRSLAGLFISKLNPGGRLFFYSGSSHFAQTSGIIEGLVRERLIGYRETYKSLVVYGRPDDP